MKKVCVAILMIAFTGLIFYPLQASGQVFIAGNPHIGKKADDFKLKLLDGGEASLSELRDRKKAIIFFWATWCPHCREALSVLYAKRQEIEDQNIKIILVNVGESKEIVKRYFERNNIYMDVFLDEEIEVSYIYGVSGIPIFFFVGKDGIVRNVRRSLPQNFEDIFYGV